MDESYLSEAMCSDGPHGRQDITFERRLELQQVAASVARVIQQKAKPHERGLLRSMIEDLVPRS